MRHGTNIGQTQLWLSLLRRESHELQSCLPPLVLLGKNSCGVNRIVCLGAPLSVASLARRVYTANCSAGVQHTTCIDHADSPIANVRPIFLGTSPKNRARAKVDAFPSLTNKEALVVEN